MAIETIRVPDLGGAEEVEVIEIPVAVGDAIELEQTLIVLESEKAAMELPAPFAGKVVKILVNEGDKFKKSGAPILELEIVAGTEQTADSTGNQTVAKPAEPGRVAEASAPLEPEHSPTAAPQPSPHRSLQPSPPSPPQSPAQPAQPSQDSASRPETPAVDADESASAIKSIADVYAGPAVRHLARELGVDLSRVTGSGPRGRILKENVHTFVKQAIAAPARGGNAIPLVAPVDFSQFGAIDTVAMTKVQMLTAANMHRSWLNVPHVTQFDDADITELEAFRAGMKPEAERRGVKLTPLPFLLKACAAALRGNPEFNRSLHPDGEHFVQKQYIHLGIAVDTPRGLLVPVIRDVDRKGLWQMAEEVGRLTAKARDGKLAFGDMQGACFTISSLGAQGGTGFTPIVNTPEAGILGVSRVAVRPVWKDGEFVPRQILPLSLSYDHRVVNGADGGRFLSYLVEVLGDIRRLLL